MSLCEASFSTWIPVSCGKCSQLHSRLLSERILTGLAPDMASRYPHQLSGGFAGLNRQPNVCFGESGHKCAISPALIGCSQDQSNTCNASLLIEGSINSKGVPNRSKDGVAVHVLASRLIVKLPSCTQLPIAIFS
jgi:hypothetical protein